jgi:hypothetical protein
VSTEEDVRALLRERGAEAIAHPGGTLYAHLLRIHNRLADLELGAGVRLAGLAHAVYGTDGFAVALLKLTERYGPYLRDLFRSWRHLASSQVTAEAERVLGP